MLYSSTRQRKAVLTAALLAASGFAARFAHAQSAEVIYTDSLKNGWEINNSWAGWDPNNTSPTRTGSNSIKATPNASSYGAISFKHRLKPYRSDLFTSFSFWIYATEPGQVIKITARRVGGIETANTYTFTVPSANTWTPYTIALSNLGATNIDDLEEFWVQDQTGQSRTFYLDDVQLNMTGVPSATNVSVNAGSTIRSFSERLFGTNLVDFMELSNPPVIAAQKNLLAQTPFRFLRWPGGNVSNQSDWSTGKRNNKDGNTEEYVNASFKQYLDILLDSTIAGKGIISVNYGQGSPEMAAAWVAYCNGIPSSSQNIGFGKDWSRTANAWVDRDWKTVAYWASLRAASPLPTDDGYNFLRIGRTAPIGIGYFEIGNENYGSWQSDLTGGLGQGYTARNGVSYGQRSRLFIGKMKEVDSTIKIGVVVDPLGEGAPAGGTSSSGWDTDVFGALAASPAVVPDFVIPHVYNQQPGKESDVYLLQSSKREWAQTCATLRAKLNAAFGTAAANTKIIATEHNLVASDPGKQSTSIVNALFVADSLGQATQTEMDGINQWAFHGSHDYNPPATWFNHDALLYGWLNTGDYSLFDGRSANVNTARTDYLTKYPTFYAWKLLKNFAENGDSVVSVTTGTPFLSAYAVKKANGKLHVLLINKHRDNAITGNLSLVGFSPQQNATVYSYGKAQDSNAQSGQTGGSVDVRTDSITNAGTSFSMSVPAYSMCLVSLSPNGGGTIAPTFTAGGSYNPGTTVAPGQPVSIAATYNVTAGTLANGILGLRLSNGTGYDVTGVSLGSGQSRTITWTFNAPTTVGTYNVNAGAWSGDWSQNYLYTSLSSLVVSAASAAQYNFDNGTVQGWKLGWGTITGITNSGDRAKDGTKSLKLTVGGSNQWSAVSVDNPNIPASKAVTAWVWIPTGTNIASVEAKLFNSSYQQIASGANGSLTAGAWNAVSVTSPSGGGVTSLAVQFNRTGTSGNWTCYLDSVSW